MAEYIDKEATIRKILKYSLKEMADPEVIAHVIHIIHDEIPVANVREFDKDIDVPDKNVGKSNADKIRAMSDEELAKLLAAQQAGVVYEVGKKLGIPPALDEKELISFWLDWLKQEESDGDFNT